VVTLRDLIVAAQIANQPAEHGRIVHPLVNDFVQFL
jgi:hypothetical protein